MAKVIKIFSTSLSIDIGMKLKYFDIHFSASLMFIADYHNWILMIWQDVFASSIVKHLSMLLPFGLLCFLIKLSTFTDYQKIKIFKYISVPKIIYLWFSQYIA